MLMGGTQHASAVDVHLRPLAIELGGGGPAPAWRCSSPTWTGWMRCWAPGLVAWPTRWARRVADALGSWRPDRDGRPEGAAAADPLSPPRLCGLSDPVHTTRAVPGQPH